MKKVIAPVLCIILIFSFSIPVYADLAGPKFKEWDVFCGIEGYNAPAVLDYHNPDYEEATETVYVEPGTRYTVTDYVMMADAYRLQLSDKNEINTGTRSCNVPSSDLHRFFLDVKEPVSPEKGRDSGTVTTVKAAGSQKIALRQGPSQVFPVLSQIPKKAQTEYRYVYSSDGQDWGYTVYGRKSGWIRIDGSLEIISSVPADSDSLSGNNRFNGSIFVIIYAAAAILILTVSVVSIALKDKRKK